MRGRALGLRGVLAPVRAGVGGARRAPAGLRGLRGLRSRGAWTAVRCSHGVRGPATRTRGEPAWGRAWARGLRTRGTGEPAWGRADGAWHGCGRVPGDRAG